MCEPNNPNRSVGPDAPFARGLAEIRTGRRSLLSAGGAGVVLSTAAGSAVAGRGKPGKRKPRFPRRRAYVLVIDGCRPDEIAADVTPNLLALRDGGYRFPRASSMPIMETIPNHVMMMTGVRPDRSGVPANSIFDRSLGETRDMDRASDIKVRTIIERLNRSGYRTGTVLSKEYLYGVFGERATARWEPAPIIPVSGHAPDVFTMEAALAMLEDVDPHLMFVNLGDIDRVGHSDLTGPLGLKAARRAALAQTDAQIGRFVDALKSSGRWSRSMLVVLADHSMDWSAPDKVITLTGPLEADPLLAGNVQIAQNGGAELLYWTGPAAQRKAAIARMQAIAAGVPGVMKAPARTKSWLRLGREAGDVVVFCEAGWRFSDPNPVSSNPIPGNHGHPATRQIPFFLSGGHKAIPKRKSSPRHARTVDVAPTLAAFFKVGKPRGGYDGFNRLAN
ncbi:alkaline phosphatase family protein [Nocardioides sp.]|uniref:alkaline phosphatase family protein n=1 Tax=Nocardioides sp. TaxID=35761 RepID=UPI00356922E2